MPGSFKLLTELIPAFKINQKEKNEPGANVKLLYLPDKN